MHAPQTAAEAKAWLFNDLLRYNDSPHRAESHTRMEAWGQHRPPEGLRAMGSGERFCPFARAPEPRQVAGDAQVSVAGGRSAVDPDLAGATVPVWCGLYAAQLYVEQGARRYGPYAPSGGPLPLHRYRSFKKRRSQQRADRLEALAAQLMLPQAARCEGPTLSASFTTCTPVTQPVADPDPFHALTCRSALDAKRARADPLGLPLAPLAPDQ